jgi:hypothetical protein
VGGVVKLLRAVASWLYAVAQVMGGRGEVDDLDNVLRARIDGDGEANAADLLSCGCAPGTSTCSCVHCGWTSCWDHRAATHLCERDPIRTWQNAPLPPHDAKQVNRAFADLINSDRELDDLRRSGRDLSKFYVIGNDS